MASKTEEAQTNEIEIIERQQHDLISCCAVQENDEIDSKINSIKYMQNIRNENIMVKTATHGTDFDSKEMGNLKVKT